MTLTMPCPSITLTKRRSFVCKSETGYRIVLDEYTAHAGLIVTALDNVKGAYLR